LVYFRKGAAIENFFNANVLKQLMEFLEGSILGLEIMHITFAIITLIISFILAKFIAGITKGKMKKIAAKTKTEFDDIIIGTIEKPIFFVIFLIGAYLAYKQLNIENAFINNLANNVVASVFIIIVAWFLHEFLFQLIDVYLVKKKVTTELLQLDEQLISLLKNVVHFGIIALTLIIIMQKWGYDVSVLIASLGVGGLAVALAGKEIISDILGGVMVFMDRPFRIGDWIKCKLGGEDIYAKVEAIELRHTKLRNLDGRTILVPNSQIYRAIITNVTSENARRFVMDIGIVYETTLAKLKKAIEIIKGILKKHQDVDEDIIVRFDEFGDSALIIKVIYKVKNKERMFDVKHEINLAIKERLEKVGIEFAYPTQTIYLKEAE